MEAKNEAVLQTETLDDNEPVEPADEAYYGYQGEIETRRTRTKVKTETKVKTKTKVKVKLGSTTTRHTTTRHYTNRQTTKLSDHNVGFNNNSKTQITTTFGNNNLMVKEIEH
jgi:hypothetical protein